MFQNPDHFEITAVKFWSSFCYDVIFISVTEIRCNPRHDRWSWLSFADKIKVFFFIIYRFKWHWNDYQKNSKCDIHVFIGMWIHTVLINIYVIASCLYAHTSSFLIVNLRNEIMNSIPILIISVRLLCVSMFCFLFFF